MPSYEEVTQRAGSVWAMTGFTAEEFTAFLPLFEHAWLAYMEDHTLDGHPRTSRRYSTYETSPLPTMADKLLFILTYVKQNECARNAFRLKVVRANIFRVHGILRPW